MSDAERICACTCRPLGQACGQPLLGIELAWGECILCHHGEHWQEGDDEPAFDWPVIFADAEAEFSHV